MPLFLRILGCLILGLLVLALAYERVVNASDENAERVSIPISQEVVSTDSESDGHAEDAATPLVDTGADEEIDVAITPEEVLESLSSEAEEIAKVLPTEDDPLDIFESDELILDAPSEPLAGDENELTAPEPPVEIAALDAPAGSVTPSDVPESADDEVEPADTLENATENASRILPDGVVFEETARPFTYRRSGRRIQRSNGSLRLPYKEMPSAWISSGVEPIYPEACEASAAETETVVVRFRINNLGRADSPKAALATNACFNKAAVAAVRQARFRVRPPAGFYLGGSTFLVSYEFTKSDS